MISRLFDRDGVMVLRLLQVRFKQKTGAPDHAIQRRANLMTHGREEIGLGAAGRLRLRPGGDRLLFTFKQLAFRLLARGDIPDMSDESHMAREFNGRGRDLRRENTVPSARNASAWTTGIELRKAGAPFNPASHRLDVTGTLVWRDQQIDHDVAKHLVAAAAETICSRGGIELNEQSRFIQGEDRVDRTSSKIARLLASCCPPAPPR